MSIEGDVSLANGVDERAQFFFEDHGTCDDALPTGEDEGIQVSEILCGVGVTHIDRHPEVDAPVAPFLLVTGTPSDPVLRLQCASPARRISDLDCHRVPTHQTTMIKLKDVKI